ncbi:M23 family metallopeptidase [Fulvivirga sp.]|uniref:M23 family metallopeptidase n=2 Tax=Fulvivirga sp. TaxID=1931237 RepID=UPI0032EAF77A
MKRKIILGLISFLIIGLLIPQNFSVPVKDASKADFNQNSFWHYPWGKSGTHKGVDIFAKKGTDVLASTSGIVLFAGEIEIGGKVIIILGPKWRIHYYAHLDNIQASLGFISRNEKIGTVGDTGNAVGKQPHLHYAIVTLLPYLWQIDTAPQGWKKMFYLNPVTLINKDLTN